MGVHHCKERAGHKTNKKKKKEIPRENSAYQDAESQQRRNGKRLWDKAKFRVTEVLGQ